MSDYARLKRFMDGMGETLASELLNGGRVVDSFLPDDSRGYVLIQRLTPKQDLRHGQFVEWWYIMLQKYDIKGTTNVFMESVEYAKLSLPSVKKKALQAFLGRD